MRDLPPADHSINVGIWVALALALVAWQVWSLTTRRSAGVIDMVRLVRRYLVTRWVLFGCWAFVGWHLFVRTHR